MDQDTQPIKICLGKLLLEINTIIGSYQCIKTVLSYTVKQITGLLDELNTMNPNDPLPDEIKDMYFTLIRDTRNKISNILKKKLSDNEFCIPHEEDVLIFKCGCKNLIDFKVYPFFAMHFLQMTTNNHKYLFFKQNPCNINYDDNEKVTIDQINEGDILYPVWYYIYENKISQNYTYMMNLIGNNITYKQLLDYRVLLKDEICMQNRKSVEASGKYKFTYMKESIVIVLPDPYNITQMLSPKDQGVIDGLYSFVDSIDSYCTVVQGFTAVNNTFTVLSVLVEQVGKFISDFEDIKQQLCCSC